MVCLLQRAVNAGSYYAADHNLNKLVSFFNLPVQIGCIGFDEIAMNPDQGFHYDIQAKQFILNKQIIQTIYNKATLLPHYIELSREETLRDVIGLYLFHEAFHIPQGIGNFEDVQLVKKVAGKSQLGEFDTLADFVAARAYAAVLNYSANGDERLFYSILHQTLFKSYSIGLRAFDFSPGDTHKIERGLSLFLVQNRIFKNLQRESIKYDHVMGLYIRCDAELGKFLVLTLEDTPARTLLLVKEVAPSVSSGLQSAVAFGNIKYIEECLKDFRIAA